MKKNQKGFTLIEIIVSIVLIGIISTISVIVIKNINTKNELKKIEKAYKVFDNALEVYLSNHEEVYKNLNDNVEGAVITLEVLKNEGLVSNNIIDPTTKSKVDYKNNYYVLSNATLLEDKKDTEINCDGEVEIEVLKSWKELSDKVDTSSVIYICPRKDSTENKNDEKIKELEEKIKGLESALTLADLGNKNYVIFDVNPDKNKAVSFSDNETSEDLWQIVNRNGNEIKLLYSTNIITDNKKMFENYQIIKNDFTTKCSWNSACYYLGDKGNDISGTLSKISFENADMFLNSDNFYDKGYSSRRPSGLFFYNNSYYLGYSGDSGYFLKQLPTLKELYIKRKITNKYVKYNNDNEWTVFEMFDNTESYKVTNSKKNLLYSQINNNLKNYIKEKNYYYSYDCTNGITVNERPNINVTFTDVFGTINPIEDGLNNIENSHNNYYGKTFSTGVYECGNGVSSYYYGFTMLSNGTVVNDSIYTTKQGFNESAVISCVGTYTVASSGKVNTEKLPNVNEYGYTYPTTNYIPVITISGTLLTDINYYPSSYKEKYSTCTNNDLGTRDCPRLFKFSNGYYSNGSMN